ncbi:hypothetical protein RPN21_02190 [Klebsiella aerogenes]|uniref:hypothetical protein n=1 Tax=Klebsiella aerogenes TaxID=548 RepID=UPI0028A48301|nr:hypothetical protein [Klebsiella aerogenes]MDT4307379.1 hypothetical protein [Klebsiella aerogenes]
MLGKSLIFILQVAAGILWIPDIFIIATIFFGPSHPEWASGWFLLESTVFLLTLVFFIWSLKRADALSLTTGLVRAGTAEEQKADRVLFWFALNGTLAGVILSLSIFVFLFAFVVLEKGLPLYLHQVAVVAVLALCWRGNHRLEARKSARGYGDYIKTTP